MPKPRRQVPPGVVLDGPLLDHQPPQSQEAEQGVLGSCMIDPVVCVPRCVEAFGAAGSTVLYDLRHSTIFDGMVAVQGKGQAVDPITLQAHLKEQDLLEQVGGIAYLSHLCDVVPSAANLQHYLDIVTDKYLLRQLVATCHTAVERVYAYEGEVSKLLDEVEQKVLAVRTVQRRSAQQTLRSVVHAVIDDINRRWDQGGGISGLPTGFADLDAVIDGLHPGELTVVAAFPSVGKTALAMNIAEHVAVDLQQGVGVFSLEMSASRLVTRMMGSVARVNMRALAKQQMHAGDPEKLTAAVARIAHSPLFIEDQAGLSIMEARAKARRMKQEHDIKLFVIDYIQLLTGKGDNREQEVASIALGCKAIAGECGVPVLALSQLNDDGQLRESRAIGQHADNVWLLERDPESDKDPVTDLITLWIKKQRDGERNVAVPLTFLKLFTRMESRARVNPDDVQ